MSNDLWRRVAEKMHEHSYMSGVERAVERVRSTGEIFTPTELVIDMLRRFDLHALRPGRTVLDPACGDGQFLVAAKWVKILAHDMSEGAALDDLYGVDIMKDNVDICRIRLGGGTILVGDTLNPLDAVPGQSVDDRTMMAQLFARGPQASNRPVKRRLARPNGSAVAPLDSSAQLKLLPDAISP